MPRTRRGDGALPEGGACVGHVLLGDTLGIVISWRGEHLVRPGTRG